ncbi:hypothetical protein Tco_0896020 [Tanacetum coccineum]
MCPCGTWHMLEKPILLLLKSTCLHLDVVKLSNKLLATTRKGGRGFVEDLSKMDNQFIGKNGFGQSIYWKDKSKESLVSNLGVNFQMWCHVSKMKFGTRNAMASEFSGSGLTPEF